MGDMGGVGFGWEAVWGKANLEELKNSDCLD